jgi:lysine 2,3-aminomutase
MSKHIIINNIQSLKEKKIFLADSDQILEEVAKKFSVSVTPLVANAIVSTNAPELSRQYVPAAAELQVYDHELTDPIGDTKYTPVKGITHRYPDRVLLKPIHTCAVYCRFCFRREKVGRQEEALNGQELNEALNYIEKNPAVWEVILSGGDPLMLQPDKLAIILKRLQKIPHVGVIRIHTRVPLVAPEKLSPAMLDALDLEKALFVVLHCNSHLELLDEVKAGLKKMNRRGIPLLSQSVLLRGVNDSAEKLEKLFRSLVSLRVKPYYLHHGDLAAGTSHFRTSVQEGQSIMKKLRGDLSGICQPSYVLDIPGGFGKVPIGPNYIVKDDSAYTVEDWQGQAHSYEEQD